MELAGVLERLLGRACADPAVALADEMTEDELRREIAAELAQALCEDCENGVKWLNERAHDEFVTRYPNLAKAMRLSLAQPSEPRPRKRRSAATPRR